MNMGRLQQLAAQQLSSAHLKRCVLILFRTVFLLGLTYIICFPLFARLCSTFMSPMDVLDSTVIYIPKNPTLDNLRFVVLENDFISAFIHTLLLAVLYGVLQPFFTCMIGYGLASYQVPFKKLIIALVVLTFVIPPQTLQISMYSGFRYIDPFSLFSTVFGEPMNWIDTPLPMAMLSVTGLAFKNGIYILLFYQFFKGVPVELREAGEIDGAGMLRIYFNLILPTAVPMLVTVCMLSFSWQWTDTQYTGLFFSDLSLLSNQVLQLGSNTDMVYGGPEYVSVLINTGVLLAILPLLILFLFAQRLIMQGIESSGIVG